MKRLVWLSFAIILFSFSSATPASKPAKSGDRDVAQIREPKDNVPEMLYAGDFSEGLAPIRMGEKFGFINKAGKIIIQPKFDQVDEFSEGLALVGIDEKGTDNRKLGFIDRTGNVVIPLKLDHAESFSDGLAKVRIGKDYERTSYIDKSGKVILELTNVRPEKFSEGLAQVCDPPKVPRGFCQFRSIDKFGNTIGFPNIRYFGQFSEGLARAIGANARHGYIDKTGKFVIEPRFFYGEPFHDGLAKVKVSETSRISESGSTEEEWGYVDKTGRFAVKPQFLEAAANFSNGLARVGINGRWGYIDKTGKFVIPPIFDQAQDFSEGVAFVLQEPDCPGSKVDNRNNKEGFIDKTGKVVLSVYYPRDNDLRWAFGCNPDFTPPPSEDPVSQTSPKQVR